MPDEPDHPIEGELRAWAESRRAAQPPDFEMHAATRRLLQGEAARVHGKAAAKPAPAGGGSFLWWRSMLVGATLAFAIGCVIWVSLPTRGPGQLAKSRAAIERQSAAPKTELKESAPLLAMDAPPPTPRKVGANALAANETAAAGRSLGEARVAGGGAITGSALLPAESKDKARSDRDEAQSAAMLAFSAPAVGTAAKAVEAEPAARAGAVPPPATAAPMALAAAATFDTTAVAAAPLRQRFQQRAASTEGAVFRRSLAAPEWPVLREFELVLGATETTVSDADGSRYTGAPVVESPAGAFVVTGTNLTLGAVVRLEGAVGRSGTNLLRVTGRARIGADRELAVDAAPAPPR